MKIITPNDLSYLDFIVDAQIAMAKETEDYDLDPVKIKAGATTVILNPHKGRYYLALDQNDNFLGMLLTMPEWSDWRNAEVIWIHSVYVRPEYRGKGVYKSMYQFLRDKVETSEEYAGIRLYVDKRNLSANKVYKKLGMSDEHYTLFEWLK